MCSNSIHWTDTIRLEEDDVNVIHVHKKEEISLVMFKIVDELFDDCRFQLFVPILLSNDFDDHL